MYIYEGVSKSGEKIKGKFNGDISELKKVAIQRGLIITKIYDRKQELKKGKLSADYIIKDLKKIGDLVSNGVNIDKAVKIIENLSNSSTMVNFWAQIRHKIKNGSTLSEAIESMIVEQNIDVPHYYVYMMRVEEEAGSLYKAIKSVVSDWEFKSNLYKSIKEALYYPVFLIILSFTVMMLMSWFILPKFAYLFQDRWYELPTLSRVVLGLGLIIRDYIVYIVTLFALVMVIFLYKKKLAINLIKALFIKLGFIKFAYIKFEMSKVASALYSMLVSGLSLDNAIKLSSKITSDKHIRNMLIISHKHLKEGGRLSELWGLYEFIDPDILSIIAVGEDKGDLASSFKEIANIYREELNSDIKKLIVFLEPMSLLIVGSVIGIIAVSILLAVLSTVELI